MRVCTAALLGATLGLGLLGGCTPQPAYSPSTSPSSTSTAAEDQVVEETEIGLEPAPAADEEPVATPDQTSPAAAESTPEPAAPETSEVMEAAPEPAAQDEVPPAATETPAPEPETPAPATETPAPAAETPAPATETPAPATETPAPTTETPAPTESPAAAASQDSATSTTVLLGDPALTAGIPGEGPLSVEQVQTWLENAENHATLNVVLPLGLSAGQAALKGLDQNPLTRAKIELGRQLYFDKRLSVDGTVSCADCHHVDEGWTRRTQFGVGIGGLTGNRNSPISYNRILSDAQFWDGRAASLEEQAIGPIANPIEMGNSHDEAVETLKGIEGYRLQFEKIFADGVTIENVGKALASFERAVVTGSSPYDYFESVRTMQAGLGDLLEDLDVFKDEEPDLYAKYTAAVEASQAHPISESAIRGRELFFSDKGGCSACHVGPNLTDEKYHNLGVGMDKAEPDLGRFVVTKEDKDRGAFKTPTIRSVALSAPYMHDGSQATLEDVMDWYVQGGHPNPYLSSDVKPLTLTEQDKADLVAFMHACTGDFPKIETGRLPQ